MPTTSIARLALACLVMAACLLIAGCEEKVTMASYEQIQEGMSMLEVERLLGGGRDETPSAGGSISSAGLLSGGDKPDEVWVWESSDGSKIVLTFAEGKVVQKQQEGLQ